MIRRLASLVVLLAVVAPQAQVTEGKPPIVSDWERVRTFAERARAKAHRLSVDPQWFGDSGEFWYVDRGPEAKTFVRVNPGARTQAPAFDHGALAAALAKETSRTVGGRDLPFNTITPEDDGAWTFTAFDQRWRWNDAEKSLSKTESGPGGARQGGGPQNTSPDGKWRFGRSNDNLTVANTETGETKRLTEDGSPTASWANARWSPDSKRLFATRVLAGDRFDMVRIESVPREGFRPRVVTQRYALPGDKLDQFELWVFDVESGSRVKVQADPVEDFYAGPPQPNWTSDGRSFRYAHLYRGYQRWVVRSVDAATGEAKILVDETSLTRIQPFLQSVQFLNDREMLVVCERDGWNHVYLHDAQTGALIRQLTQGHWSVRNIVRVDHEAKRIVFLANGREPGDPYHVHAYSVDLGGGAVKRLTGAEGHHAVSWSPNGRYLVDTQSTVETPPTHTVRDAVTGEAILELPGATIRGLADEGWRAPTPFVAKARDGATDLYGVIWFPSHLKPNWKYPVVEYIYAGPHDAHVPKAFAATDRNRMLAELGVIVVQVDALGTGRRGKAFSDHSHKNLGDAGLDDRIGWMRAAAEKYPQMDLGRVGIYGYSAGGYDSTRALLAKPEFYKAAVSLCGNHDHRTDKVWWNELWMGYPVGPEYADQSNIENAENLQGKLLLIAGELDDNVNPHAATLRLVDALVKADKDFDMLFLPGRNHNLGGWYVDRRIYRHFVEHLGVGSPAADRTRPIRPGGN